MVGGVQKRKRDFWTAEEDALLTKGREEFGDNNWMDIVNTLLPGRTGQQCFDRWEFALNPAVKRGKFSAEEDANLIAGQGEYGNRWVEMVTALMPGRTGPQCRQRWENTLNPTIKNGPWTPEEDAALTKGYTQYGKNQWLKIADALLPGRTVAQCKNRWEQTLDTAHQSGFWTPVEDAALLAGHKQLGPRWADIASTLLSGRTGNQCQKRWLHTLDPAIKKGKFSAEEDAKLIEGNEQYGNSWKVIAAELLPGRTGKQCQQRWNININPCLKSSVSSATTLPEAVAPVVKKIKNKSAQVVLPVAKELVPVTSHSLLAEVEQVAEV
jgi:hypothetical protein